jgi:hypothetical protein
MFRLTFRTLGLSIFAIIALALAACEVDDRAASSQYLGGVYGSGAVASSAPQDTVSYWDGDGASGSPSIKIKLSEQRAYFYKGGQLVGISQLSTGREGRNTPVGKYSVVSKDLHHVSSKYGDYVDSADNVVSPNIDIDKDPKPPGTHYKGASMPFYMQIAPGFGLHAGYLPGYPASHGCIRMPEFMAENFYKSVKPGTPVTITE